MISGPVAGPGAGPATVTLIVPDGWLGRPAASVIGLCSFVSAVGSFTIARTGGSTAERLWRRDGRGWGGPYPAVAGPRRRPASARCYELEMCLPAGRPRPGRMATVTRNHRSGDNQR